MKTFLVLMVVAFSAVCGATEETCAAKVSNICGSLAEGTGDCSAKYASALVVSDEHSALVGLQLFAVDQLKHSLEFMLRASYFGSAKMSRPGFAKLYRAMSDAAWADAIDAVQHVALRGGNSVFEDIKAPVDWKAVPSTKAGTSPKIIEIGVSELESLGRALDAVKTLAQTANDVHRKATHNNDHHRHHDAEVAHYVEERFAHRYAESVRSLAGHGNDLKTLLIGSRTVPNSEKSLSLFLFDEHLLKL